MTNSTPKPQVHYALIAFDFSKDRPLLFRKTPDRLILTRILLDALDLGATLISIRRIHPPPQGQPLHQNTPTSPTSNLTAEGDLD